MPRRSWIGSTAATSWPSTSTVPAVGATSRLISLSVVVLPQPDGPSSATVVPRLDTQRQAAQRDVAVGVHLANVAQLDHAGRRLTGIPLGRTSGYALHQSPTASQELAPQLPWRLAAATSNREEVA